MVLKGWLSAAAVVGVLGLVGSYVLVRPGSVVRTETYEVPAVSAEQLQTFGGLKVFFGHQSVGRNMLDALPTVYATTGIEAPAIVESEAASASTGGYVQHVNIGENGDPLGKLAEFDRLIRGGVGEVVDVAVFKFCYVDFHEGDDVDEIFGAYKATLAALERDYPDVTFVYTSVPLTTERGPLGRVKGRLGFGDKLGPEHNVVREQLNSKIRAEYADTGLLFDIAAIQSSTSEGERLLRTFGGSEYYAMDGNLSSDPGHLNTAGAALVAGALVATVADAVSVD
jgi:hypothetical protein